MNIRVDLTTPITDGTEVVFRSPVDCSQITGLIVYYNGDSKEFALADAHGNNVGDIDHLFAENAVVKVILDVTHGMAFVQNADTNAYIEGTFVKTVNGTAPDKNGNVTVAGGINLNTAQVGQTIRVKEVDEDNKPTEWEAVDLPTGGGSSNVFHFTTEVEEDAVEEFTIELPTTYENIFMFNVHITFGTIEQDFTLYSTYGANNGMTFDIKTANLVNGQQYGANVYSVRYHKNFFTHQGSQAGYTYAAYPGIGGRLNVKNMNSNTVGFYTRPYGVSIPKGTKFEIWGLCK